MKAPEILPLLITAKDAAGLLGVSPPTFKKIQKQYNIRRVKIGARYRYFKKDVLKVFKLAHSETAPQVKFNVFQNSPITKIEVAPGVLDLRGIQANSLDPYGTLSLFCEIAQRAKKRQRVELLVDDSIVCSYLRHIGFFDELESRYRGLITWDREILRGARYRPNRILIPLKAIRMKKDEQPLVEKLVDMLKKQGFKEDVRNYISSIIGELVDNAMTHSSPLASERICYFLVEKFVIGDNNIYYITKCNMWG